MQGGRKKAAAPDAVTPNQSLAQNQVIPAQAGIQPGQTARETYKITVLSRFAGNLLSTGFPPGRE